MRWTFALKEKNFILKLSYCCFLLQEAAFRKVVQTTMVRDRQHGPVIELNRIQVKHQSPS